MSRRVTRHGQTTTMLTCTCSPKPTLYVTYRNETIVDVRRVHDWRCGLPDLVEDPAEFAKLSHPGVTLPA